jgi:hypothetical protein
VQLERPRLSDSEIIRRHVPLDPDDLNFNEAASVTLLANAVRQPVASFRTPLGFLGLLRTFATGVGNAGDWASITWSLTINKTPIYGFANMVGPIAELLHPFDALRLAVPITKNGLVEIVASNSTAVAIAGVQAMLRGHVFPDEAREPMGNGR